MTSQFTHLLITYIPEFLRCCQLFREYTIVLNSIVIYNLDFDFDQIAMKFHRISRQSEMKFSRKFHRDRPSRFGIYIENIYTYVLCIDSSNSMTAFTFYCQKAAMIDREPNAFILHIEIVYFCLQEQQRRRCKLSWHSAESTEET